MRALAKIVMRGRGQAIMSVTVLGILSLLLAPLSILSAAAVALVTLRQGAKDGMFVILASWLASSILSYLLLGDALPAAVFALVLWAPVWLLSQLLRYSRSIDFTLQATLAVCVMLIGYFYLVIADPALYWAGLLEEPLKLLLQNSGVSTDAKEFETLLESVSRWMTAALAAGFFLQLAATLFLARWWQAELYNPDGFGLEFRQLRFHKLLALLTVPVFIWVTLGQPPEWLMALAMLLLATYFLQGLAVAHGLLKQLNANVAWILGIYFLLIIAMPYAMTAIAMTGFSDAWMNFRKSANAPGSGDGN